jgi:hypothetical protein
VRKKEADKEWIPVSTIEKENKKEDQILKEKAVPESSRIIPGSEKETPGFWQETKKKNKTKQNKQKEPKGKRETEIESARTKPAKHDCWKAK